MPGFRFFERMQGTLVREGERFDRPFRFELEVHGPSLLGFLTTAVCSARGTVRIDGMAKDVPAEGTLEISPLLRRRIRYTFTFAADDGKPYRFDGWKTVTLRRHLIGWTTLPGTLYDGDGAAIGTATLRFDLRGQLGELLRSFRIERG